MAHYIFQRNNGYGDMDFIQNFNTMSITDYPHEAAQVEDKYLAYIDMGYLNQLGFYAVGIRQFNLKIDYYRRFTPSMRGFRPPKPARPPRPRAIPPRPRPRTRAVAHAPHPVSPLGVVGAIVRAVTAPPKPPKPPKPPRPPRVPAARGYGPGPHPKKPGRGRR
ncbi:MAG: hypothetical protein IJD86_00650 [Clostridia bacterium]|nr:hypothetical protein [Clostridia bacterium]